jgi:hypothetical protein
MTSYVLSCGMLLRLRKGSKRQPLATSESRALVSNKFWRRLIAANTGESQE